LFPFCCLASFFGRAPLLFSLSFRGAVPGVAIRLRVAPKLFGPLVPILVVLSVRTVRIVVRSAVRIGVGGHGRTGEAVT